MKGAPALLLGLLLAGSACSSSTELLLPVALPLNQTDGGGLTAQGEVRAPRSDGCFIDSSETNTVLSAGTNMMIDTATPLSGYRMSSTGSARDLSDRVVLRSSLQGPVRGLLCQAPMFALGTDSAAWSLGLDNNQESIGVVLGGDELRNYALRLSFRSEPLDPTCTTPPCLRIAASDIIDNCQLAARGQAVLPFTLLGGDLLVQLGSDLLTYPPTRATVAACIEPYSDPWRTTVPCVNAQALNDAAAAQTLLGTAAPMSSSAQCQALTYAAELMNLSDRLSNGNPACVVAGGPAQLPPPDEAGVSSDVMDLLSSSCGGYHPPSSSLDLQDAVEGELPGQTSALRNPQYMASGADALLLVSTAIPALLLSTSFFARLRGASAAAALSQEPGITLHLPGLDDVVGHSVLLGQTTTQQLLVPSLALISRERQLSPCGELARSRRQRFGLPTPASAAQACNQAACMQDLLRDPAQQQRRCGYSGQNLQLACSDQTSPVASVVELPPMQALVVPDTAAVLQAVNADLRTGGNPQVDGILGVPVLQQLAAEVDLAKGRLNLLCGCECPVDQEATTKLGCLAFPRFTDSDADDCASNSQLEVSAGATPAATCAQCPSTMDMNPDSMLTGGDR